MKEKRKGFTGVLKEYTLMTLGTLLVGVGLYFFKFQNNFCTGGVSGISVILGHLVKSEVFSSGFFMLALNVLLLLVGFIFLGRGFGFKTVYCSLLLSGFTYAMEFIAPMSKPLTDNKLLELCFAILLPAIGSAVLFNLGASTGGTDIVAMIIKKFTNLNISTALMVSDCLIVMATLLVFDVQTWLYCCLGFFAKALVVNNVLENMNTSKYITIISDHGEEIEYFITNELHKSATVSGDFVGAFTHDRRCVVLTVVTRAQAIKLKKYMKTIDPHAFVIVSNTSDIVGKGFREVM